MSGRELPTLEVVPAWRGATGSEPRHVLRPEYFGSLVYDRETFQYMPFDAEATGLLLDPARATGEDARAFVRGLEEEGLLGADGRFDGRVVADRAHPGRLSAPLTVYLGATEGCNLACSHCQADSGPGALVPFPPALMRALFEEQYALGAMQVHVTGGEPLLHPALFEGLEAAFELGLNVMLTTNATTLTPRLADALAARPFRTLSVSLDGADAASHDAIRGEGAFARALEGLRLLAARAPVGVTATLTPGLLGRIEALARLCEEAGAASLYLRPALPAGRAREDRAWLPEAPEFDAAAAELDRAQAAVSIPLFRPSRVPHQEDSARVLERFGCVAGNLVCSVTPRGQVSPCALLGPEFDSGDLATQGLHALWSQGAGFTRLRALEGNSDCWSCKHYDSCGGGCRARALAAGRGLDDPDPWCHYEPREGA